MVGQIAVLRFFQIAHDSWQSKMFSTELDMRLPMDDVTLEVPNGFQHLEQAELFRVKIS